MSFSLRKKGWLIANRVEIGADGVKRGFFRLAQPLTYPNPKAKRAAAPLPAVPEPPVERADLFPEFDPLPCLYRDPEEG